MTFLLCLGSYLIGWRNLWGFWNGATLSKFLSSSHQNLRFSTKFTKTYKYEHSCFRACKCKFNHCIEIIFGKMVALSICYKSVKSLPKTELPKNFYSTLIKLDLFFTGNSRKVLFLSWKHQYLVMIILVLHAPGVPKKINMSSIYGSLWLAENEGCVTVLWDTCKIRTLIFFTSNQLSFVQIIIVGD